MRPTDRSTQDPRIRSIVDTIFFPILAVPLPTGPTPAVLSATVRTPFAPSQAIVVAALAVLILGIQICKMEEKVCPFDEAPFLLMVTVRWSNLLDRQQSQTFE
jgi:hypothetical protein